MKEFFSEGITYSDCNSIPVYNWGDTCGSSTTLTGIGSVIVANPVGGTTNDPEITFITSYGTLYTK